ncbi:Vesicle-trafficking protein sec22b, partial [Globisporangium splendens]
MAGTNLITQRFPLRSIERVMSWTKDACFKIATVMLVKSQVEELVCLLPTALMHTFNKHPKMRATQVRGEFAVGEIHPKITLEQLEERQLLLVRAADAEGMQSAHWHQYAQEQVDIPFDRFTQFPFCLHVSGNAVLNDVLAFASLKSATARPAIELNEHPVLPGLFHATLNPYPVLSRVFRFLVKMTVKKIVKSAPIFTPIVKPRADQQHFSSPPPFNSSKLLFAEGTEENLRKLLARCREEGTTFFGALMAAVLLGHAVVSDPPQGTKNFQMNLLMSFNMRGRVYYPLPADAVGSYATVTPLEKLTQGGIDLSTKRFWDIARAAKQETVDISSSFPAIAVPMAVTDQVYNSQRDPESFNDVSMPYSSSRDAMISSVKRYAYPTNHTFQQGDLTVETVRYSCRTGCMAPLGQFYVSSTKRACCGYSHCYEEHTGKLLFETVVAFLEHAGCVASNDTLADVIAQVPAARQSSLHLSQKARESKRANDDGDYHVRGARFRWDAAGTKRIYTRAACAHVASMESIGDANGNLDTYKQQGKQIMKKLDQRSPTKCSIESGPYTFQYESLCSNCLGSVNGTTRTGTIRVLFPKRLAFLYLEEIHAGFVEELERDHGTNWRDVVTTVARPYAFIKFAKRALCGAYIVALCITFADKFIQKKRKEYMDPNSSQNMHRLNDDLADIHNIMRKNIQEVLNRGERVEHVSRISSNLADRSKDLKWGAKKLRMQAIYRQYAPIAAVTLFVLLVIYMKFF